MAVAAEIAIFFRTVWDATRGQVSDHVLMAIDAAGLVLLVFCVRGLRRSKGRQS